MRSMIRSLTALSLFSILAGLAPAAGARELGGVNVPEAAFVDGKSLVLNGAGIRTKMMFKVYVGALYVEAASKDAAAILRDDKAKKVVLHIVHSKVEKAKLVEAWTEGFKSNSAAAMPALQSKIDQFNGWMSDVVKGESIEVGYAPGKGTTVAVKGKELGIIEGKDFADAVFAIWLGPKPVHEGLKEGMLGID